MAGIKDYSATASSNTAINSINIAEGCPPSGINDAIRQEMADTRSFYESGSWIDLGYTHTYASSTSVTISGADRTAYYPAGRRIKAVGTSTGTIYGKVASSSFATNTTINFTWDSGSLSNETLTIYVGFVNVTGKPIDSSAISGSFGTVTSLVAGTGLTGGTITTSGTIAVDVGTTANKIPQLGVGGILAATLLGTGSPSSSNYLRGDGAWSAITGSTQAKMGTFTRDTSTASGTQAVTGVGFTPDYLIVLSGVTSSARMSIGMASRSPATYGIIWDNNGVSAGTYQTRTDYVSGLITDGSNNYLGTVNSWDADGFTINWTKTGSTTGTATMIYLAIKV